MHMLHMQLLYTCTPVHQDINIHQLDWILAGEACCRQVEQIKELPHTAPLLTHVWIHANCLLTCSGEVQEIFGKLLSWMSSKPLMPKLGFVSDVRTSWICTGRGSDTTAARLAAPCASFVKVDSLKPVCGLVVYDIVVATDMSGQD